MDVCLAPIALLLTIFFKLQQTSAFTVVMAVLPCFFAVAAATLAGSLLLGMPKIRLKAYEAIGVIKTAALAAIAALGLWLSAKVWGIPLSRTSVFLFFLIFMLTMIIARFAMLHLLLSVLRLGQVRQNVVIYGAGNTGTMLATALWSHETIRVVAFIDDSPSVQGLNLLGLKVLPRAHLERVVARYDVERVLLAMPSVPSARQAVIVRDLVSHGLDVHTLPSFAQLVGVEALLDSLAPVAPGAFLGRDPVSDLVPEASDVYTGKTILVSGAGGSVGSELCRQLLRYRPAKILLFEISEIALYNIHRELIDKPEWQGIEYVPILGTVTEARQIRSVLAEHCVDVVLHAAAYKHVPMVEANPIAGLVNNVLGTRTIAEAALEAGVKRFILISTDKAVRPTNVMGASKRMAELMVQDMARRSNDTDFSIVRFGNVLGSSGSVVPLFREQIQKGGPVTLTHEDVTRYFMTIAEAASLVLIAGGMSSNRGTHEGDLFVLDMGQPIRIRDLAERMISAAGFSLKSADNPNGDIEIAVIGLRPGEKLHEELLIEPGMLTTPHDKILRVQERGLTAIEVVSALRELRGAVALGNACAARAVIETYVEGYAMNVTGLARPA